VLFKLVLRVCKYVSIHIVAREGDATTVVDDAF
jgi:hypothetical protein